MNQCLVSDRYNTTPRSSSSVVEAAMVMRSIDLAPDAHMSETDVRVRYFWVAFAKSRDSVSIVSRASLVPFGTRYEKVQENDGVAVISPKACAVL